MRDGVDPATWLIAGGRTRAPGQPLNVAPQLASNYYLPADRDYSRAKGTETSEAFETLLGGLAVSYTHLTLPTILLV